MTATYADFKCPECDSDVYDNTENKRNPKAPDYKCSNRDCDWVQWPERGRGSSKRSGGYRREASTRDSRPAAAPTRQNDDRSNRIERQHSQEMALRLVAMEPGLVAGKPIDLKKLK